MLGKLTRLTQWTVTIAICSTALGTVALTRSAYSQEGFFDDDLSGSTSETNENDLFGSDPSSPPPGTTPPDQGELQAQFNERIAQAQELLDQEDWSGALEVFQSVAELGPGPASHAYVRLGVGICHVELGSPDLAITALSEALVAQGAGQIPGLTQSANFYLGRAYLDTGVYRDAYRQLQNARQSDPNSPEINMYFGKAALRVALTSTSTTGSVGSATQSQIMEAIQALTKAIELEAQYGEAYLERGRALQRIRRIDYAIEDFQDAVRYLGGDSEAAADLGIAYVQRASQESVRPDADAAQVQNDLRSGISTMDTYLASVQIGQRTPPWETVDPLKQSPDDVMLSRADGKIKLGEELNNDQSNGHYESAIADAKQILDARYASDEAKGRAYYYQGLAQRMKGELAEAVKSFSDAIATNAPNVISESYLRRGICFFHQDKLELAEMDFDAAATSGQNPLGSDPRAMMWKGIARAEQGDHNQAIRSYTRAVRYAPRYVAAYLNRGVAYLNVGRYQRAIEDFDTVLRQDPANEQAAGYRDLAEQHRN